VLVPHAPNARSDRDKLAAKAIRFMICLPKRGLRTHAPTAAGPLPLFIAERARRFC
jgi:hypothetical protein